MPFQSIEPRRLYRQIADQIRGLIQAGEYGAGARLPAERDLARELGVSRPSVREALIALEVEGLVEVRIGSGIYVRGATTGTRAIGRMPVAGPFELLRARYVIESECAALAARSAKRPQLRSIENALERHGTGNARGPPAAPGGPPISRAIAEATGNAALVHVVRLLWDERTGALFKRLEDHYDSPRLWRTAIAEHRAVLKSIAARDADGARAAMQRHLDQASKRFSKGWNAPRNSVNEP